jgi:hypothetical protein
MASEESVREYNRQYYKQNREKLLKRQAEKNRRFSKTRRKWLVDYKKTLKCVRCDESHPATLTFHHREDADKQFEIGNAIKLGIGLDRLKAEIGKCDVLCANCHAKEHLAYLFD